MGIGIICRLRRLRAGFGSRYAVVCGGHGCGLVCKHPYPRAKIRQSVCKPSFAHRASGSPASAQPAWERICAAGRGETAALKMPPPRPESGTKTPEVFSGVKRPEGEHWRRERSRLNINIPYAQYRRAEPRKGRALECTERKTSAQSAETRRARRLKRRRGRLGGMS